MPAKSFTTEELEEFLKLKRREKQLLKWAVSLTEEMTKLERQKAHQEQELEDLQKTINKNFRALNGKLELFSLSDVPDSALEDVGSFYISHEKKKLILKAAIDQYQKIYPDSENLPFKWLKQHLEEKYQIKCRSVSNFFKGIFEDLELAGGNRNRSIVLS